jgi:alanine dehydrogenase
VRHQEGFRNGVYMYNGTLTNENIANQFELPWKDLNLLLAVF